jgi:ABC-type multidrug transport system fused ATPase/permease subunit
MGENLIYKIRNMLFENIIYKDINWFYKKSNSPGVLSNILSEDITLLNGLTTETVSILLEAIFTLVIGFSMSCYFSWRMALISLATVPLVIIGAYITIKLTAKAKEF